MNRRDFFRLGAMAAVAASGAAVGIPGKAGAAAASAAEIVQQQTTPVTPETIANGLPSKPNQKVEGTNPADLPDFENIPKMQEIINQYRIDYSEIGSARARQKLYFRVALFLLPRNKEATQKFLNAEDLKQQVKALEDKLESANDTTREDLLKQISYLRDLIKDLENFEYSEDVRNLRYLPMNNIWTCNIYATDFFAAICSQQDELPISHRVDQEGNPVKTGGRELDALGMMSWLESYGAERGFKDVTDFTLEQKIYLLSQGYIFYGCYDYPDNEPSLDDYGHNYIIFGINSNGRTIPILSQATTNVTALPIEGENSPVNAWEKLNTVNHEGGGRWKLYALLPNV